MPWRRKWQPTPVFLPGKPHGQKSLESCSPWGHKESDTAKWLNHPHWIRVGPNSNTWCPCKKKKEYTEKRHTEQMTGDNGGRLEWYSYKPRKTQDYRSQQKLGRGKEGLFHRAFRGSRAWLTPWLQTSHLQNCERISFCCSKPPNL